MIDDLAKLLDRTLASRFPTDEERLLRLTESFLGRAAMTKKWRELDPLERNMEADLARAFKKQLRVLLALLPKYFTLREAEPVPDERFDWEAALDGAFDASLADFLSSLSPIGAATVLGGLHKGIELDWFDTAHPDAYAWLAEHGAELVANINDATREDLRRIIYRGMITGQSYDRIAKTIRDKYDEFSTPKPQLHIRSRAHGIAVTELGRAYEEGGRQKISQMQDVGLSMEKDWLTVSDGRVDPLCQALERIGWIDVDIPYDRGIEHPPAHPYCRCTIRYRRKP